MTFCVFVTGEVQILVRKATVWQLYGIKTLHSKVFVQRIKIDKNISPVAINALDQRLKFVLSYY